MYPRFWDCFIVLILIYFETDNFFAYLPIKFDYRVIKDLTVKSELLYLLIMDYVI